ncbi:hypothetical protein ABT234_15675 [Streptomyces sp. NPDC001586]|uniref:hypothetical protein n=1 Tax=Streptomyces sp. NPDC001586 TaxID=3154387 RepID=UPI003317B9CF
MNVNAANVREKTVRRTLAIAVLGAVSAIGLLAAPAQADEQHESRSSLWEVTQPSPEKCRQGALYKVDGTFEGKFLGCNTGFTEFPSSLSVKYDL